MSERLRPARPTPPAPFLFLDLPFGAAVGYARIAMPSWLRRGGVSVAEVAAVSRARPGRGAARALRRGPGLSRFTAGGGARENWSGPREVG